MQTVSVLEVEAILAGLVGVGVDVAPLRSLPGMPRAGLPGDETLPAGTMGIVWREAMVRLRRPTAPIEIGLAVPFGAFGMVDYLVASASTIEGALRALVLHFAAVGAPRLPALSLVEDEHDAQLEFRVPAPEMAWVPEEFSIAVTLKNLRHIASGPLEVLEVWTTRADPAPGALAACLGTEVRFEQPVAAIRFPRRALSSPLRTADPHLHHAMRVLADALGLGAPADSLEGAIRARLRDLLRLGDGTASSMARALGTTERSLHRHLGARGTTWRALLDSFRLDESRRLLVRGLRLAEIALAVGFSDQTTWTRAFRRWTGQSPAQWKREALASSAAAR